MKPTFKRNLILILSFLSIIVSLVSSMPTVSADTEEKFDEEVNKYIGDADSFEKVLEKYSKDTEGNRNPSKNTILHVIDRMIGTGKYLNDVEYGVVSSNLDVKKEDILYDGKYACHPNAPLNLLNHNCNIPNFTTGLLQNIAKPFYSPFTNAEKTTSYATFGLGVPDNIPGGQVPIVPGNRAHKYTALELYGYDLKVTSYTGEWDKIDVSSEARMLSNFGVIDNITLTGTALWNSTKAGMASLIDNFSFNPIRWISTAIDAALSGGINTVIDTSDLNIVASNGWKRSQFNDSLYNVYVMTNNEILAETHNKYFREFIEYLKTNAELSPELNAVLELEEIPDFTFKPEWEKEESIKARRSAEEYNRQQEQIAQYDPNHIVQYKQIPEPVYYTEKEQLVFWGDNNSGIIEKAKGQGILEGDISSYDTYDEITSEWIENWGEYFSEEFNALGVVVETILELTDNDVFNSNPHLDPKQPISQYACANPDGTIKRDENGNVEYLYLSNNKGTTEYVNPNCAPARPPIGGALFGSGWTGNEKSLVSAQSDTRHIDNIQDSGVISSIIESFGNMFMSIFRSMNSFIARMTNTLLGLAFSPILSELGIDAIVGQLVEGFKNTIFFPLAALAVTVGAFILFFQVLKGQGFKELMIAVSTTLLVFIAGGAFLMYPESTVKLVDELPTSIDTFLSNAVLVDDDGTGYCSTGDESDGIRSAQCNVWGIMVFNPWVHLQFGDAYENLYANGHAPEGGNSFNNENTSLVGDAGVYMGNGVTVNNWALYQLDKTKAGTINMKADTNDESLGKVDKDMYRLVDLQAGPQNGKNSDTRRFETWSGMSSGGGFVGLLTTIQNVIVAFAITGLAITKIEVSFIFAISIIILPIMLLVALMPIGQNKLKKYMSTLISLLLKRVVVVMMMSVLLKTLSISYSTVSSIAGAATLAIFISVAFIIYKKELLNLITGSENTGKVKELVADTVPLSIKQKYATVSADVKGRATGFVGGALGYLSYKNKADNQLHRNQIELDELNKIDEADLTDKEVIIKARLTQENEIITKRLNESQGLLYEAEQGMGKSAEILGRSAERKLRKDGYASTKVSKQARYNVIQDGADRISENENPAELDTFREVLSQSEKSISKTTKDDLDLESARTLQSPKVQREVRRLAEKRVKHAEKYSGSNDYTALTPDREELGELAKIIDKKRKANSIKGKITSPRVEKSIEEDYALANRKKDDSSGVLETMKRLISKEYDDLVDKHKELNKVEDKARGKLIEELNSQRNNPLANKHIKKLAIKETEEVIKEHDKKVRLERKQRKELEEEKLNEVQERHKEIDDKNIPTKEAISERMKQQKDDMVDSERKRRLEQEERGER